MKNSTLIPVMFFLAACAPTPEAPEKPPEVEYWGIPDLAIQAFIPPVILAGEGDTIYLSDLTTNVGDGMAPASVTRYFISHVSPVDLTTALVIGERTVAELRPGQSDESMEKPFVIPAGAGSPPLFLAACADVANDVDELHEDDNCTVGHGANQQIFDSGAVMPAGPDARD